MKDKMLFYTHAYQMIYTWISIYTCVCKDINIYVYTYIYMFIHTYIREKRTNLIILYDPKDVLKHSK